MANCYSCGCLFSNVNTNFRFLIMANKEKFLHNINKAKRQRENERQLLERKFYNAFNPFNTSNLKNNEDV